MAIPRIIKWPLWFLLAIVVIVGLSALLLMTETAQTAIAHYFLKDFNSTLHGRIEFSSVHVELNGELELTGLSIRDSLDNEVVGLSKLRVTVDPWGLYDQRIHIYRLKLTGLRTRFELDSTGNNITALFPASSAPAETAAAGSFDWPIKIDKLEIAGERTTALIDQQLMLDLDSWELETSGSYIDNSIEYDLHLHAEQGIELTSQGNADLSGDLPSVQAELDAALDSVITAHFPDPVFKLGTIKLSTKSSFLNDSLSSQFEFTSSTLGQVSGAVAAVDPTGDLSANGTINFSALDISVLTEDTLHSDLNGSLTFTREFAPDYVNGWIADLRLDDSHIMNETLATELAIRTQDSTAWLNGSVDSPFGRARLDLVIGGFDPAVMSAQGDLSISNVNLHHFLSDVPDSLSPLSGLIQLDFPSLNPDSLAGQTYLRMNKLAFGRHRLDSAVVYAHINGQAFEVDTLKLLLGEIAVAGKLNGTLGDELAFEISGVVPELADIGELLHSLDLELDSLAGHLEWDLNGRASLAGDSLSQLTLHGDVRIANGAYGEYSVERAGLRITDYALDSNDFSGALGAFGICAAGQLIDSATVVAHGNPTEIHTTAELWMLGDTLHLSTTFDTRLETDRIGITLDQLILTTFGAEWRTAYPSDITLIDDRVEIDGIQFTSPYGVLRAIGFVQAEGEQDLTVELAGFQPQRLANLVDFALPDANVNIRLQMTGTDTALTGDVAVSVDSLIYDGNLISEELYLFANILPDQIALEGHSNWYSDTLTTFHGQIPARLSFNDGFVLREDEPLSGEARIFDQPLDRLNPWLALGSKLGGILSADFKIHGTPQDPDWEGYFSVRDGIYIDPRIGVNYKYMVLDGKLHGDSLIISQFRATAKGTLSGSGYAVMGFPMPEYLNLNLKFDRFNAQNSSRQKARLTGHTTVTGPFDSLDVRGNLKIEELLYRITQATSKEIETVDLEAYLSKLRGDSIIAGGFVLDDLYRGMSHDLRIEIPGNCWMRGGGVNIELFGDISLYKEKNADPVVNGEISVRRGTVEFAGRELKVDKGTVQFVGPIDDPTLDIVATDQKILRTEGATISIHMSGPVSNTQIDFSGVLADGTVLSKEKAVEDLLLGTTVSGGSFDVTQSAANIAAAPVSKLIEKTSGLDVFQFRPGEGGINDLSSGSLEVGTYLTDRLFIRVLQPIETIQSGQEVSIEYQLEEWLKLIAEQKGREQSAFDVYVQLEWR